MQLNSFGVNTFRDHLSSLFQSAATDLARSHLPAGTATPGMENERVNAATQIAGYYNNRQPIPAQAPAGIAQTLWDCTAQGFELMQAAAAGNTSKVAALQADGQFNQCDPAWADVILNYVTFLAKNGMRDTIPYIRAGQISPVPIAMPANPKVAIIGDWGTGTATAISLLEQVAAHDPDVLIHLGDIYYSGTVTECNDNFRAVIDKVFKRPGNPIPVFTLSGNHDMYSGGEGYYAMLQSINPLRSRQSASFFCMRATDDSWQFAAMDTGLHDDDPFNVDTVRTYLEADEEAWLIKRISEFSGRTILLSHHQLFSALAQIGPADAGGALNPVNPNLQSSFLKFSNAAAGNIAAWFWGHEHMFTMYESYSGLDKGRCLGCGAIPQPAASAPYVAIKGLAAPPPFMDQKLPVDAAGYYTHAFAMLTFAADKTCKAEYYETLHPGTPLFSEML